MLGLTEITEPGQLLRAMHDERLSAYPASVLRSPGAVYTELERLGAIERELLHVDGAILHGVTVTLSLTDEPMHADGLCLHTACLRALADCTAWIAAQLDGL
ncbi:MAG: hypothetical protein JHC95_14265 [Solirubrobacteraceae bacterium]|nr:hypothetical protein [Solirubrobacteraceae bacterium]